MPRQPNSRKIISLTDDISHKYETFYFRIDKALLSVVDLIFLCRSCFAHFLVAYFFFFRLFSKCAKNIEFLFSCFAPTSWKCLVRAKFSAAAVKMPQFTTARKTEICDFSRRLAMQDVTLEMSSVSLASSSRADRYFRFWKIMMFHFLRNTYCHCQRIFWFAGNNSACYCAHGRTQKSFSRGDEFAKKKK